LHYAKFSKKEGENMSFTMTNEEWADYQRMREASYVMKNERLRPEGQDLFEWLNQGETKEEKAEYAKIMEMCAA
jgi:hypothetical protein